ncbi:MAG: ABC transporter permease [Clostridia bacterium]|nr:ABC transporter permease [Clostridia bacterium]
MSDDTTVDVTILANNIQKIYKTTKALANRFEIADYISPEEKLEKEMGIVKNNSTTTNNKAQQKSTLDTSSNGNTGYTGVQQVTGKEESFYLKLIFEGISNSEDIEPSLEYNTQLLNYAGVLEVDTAFMKSMVAIGIAVIAVIMLVSSVMLYTAFKMTYSERLKEFGMLSSIGMNNKQKKTIIKKEARILSIVGIFVGILIGLAISKLLTSGINILLKNYIFDIIHITSAIMFDRPRFFMKVPVIILVLTIIVVYIVIIISSKLSLRKLNKLSPIEAIRGTTRIKTNKKQLKSSNIIQKLFGIEGVVAHKNIKRDKSRYRTITISLTVSIILFLSITGITENFYKSDAYGMLLPHLEAEVFEDEVISFNNSSVNQQDIYRVADYLEENELIKDYCTYSIYNSSGSGHMKLMPNITSNKVKKMISDGIYTTGQEGEIYIPFITICYYGKAYKAILEKVGISELADDEVILMDTIKENSKNEKKFRLTDYKVGDSYNVTIDGQEKTLRIVGIIEDFNPYTVYNSRNFEIYSPTIVQMVNENNIGKNNFIELAVSTDKLNEIYERMETISNIIGEEVGCRGTKLFAESTKTQEVITEVVINCYICLLSLVSAVNIYNTISSSMLLRKKDFAVLKSMGMSEKQINKMMRLEGIFYGLDSIFYGVLISLAILFVIYPRMGIDMMIYPFTIPWLNIGICVVAVYAVIFVSMRNAKKKIANKNIIDEIREENI